MRRHRTVIAVVGLCVLIGSLVVVAPAAVQAETPRRGGVLLAAIAADAPSLDPHQEQTFATIELVAPLYSTLIQIDPLSYPKIIGDAATEWKIAPDGLTYTFKVKSYTRGSTFEGERNPDYFVKDRPHLDGYKFFISTETSVRAAALRSGRAWIEFRTMPLAEVEAIRKQLGDKVVVQDTAATGQFGIAMNQTTKPFADIRVRKALTLGLDRYTASRVLYPIASLKDVGALMRPGTEFAMSESELHKLPGFGRDMEKNRAEAKRLLAEAGYPNGFRVALKNRNVRIPYVDFGVFTIQEWRKIGIEAEHRPLETASWFADGRDAGNFEVIVNGVFNYMDDPDLFLERYTTGDTNNWGRFSDPRIDDLFARQTRALDPAERKRLVNELEKIVLENAYHIPGLWWSRSVVHWAKVKNYVAPPNHYSNQKLQDVWLAED